MDKTNGEAKRDTCSNAILINQLIFSAVRVRHGVRTARTSPNTGDFNRDGISWPCKNDKSKLSVIYSPIILQNPSYPLYLQHYGNFCFGRGFVFG
jgi:hypothetical protein